MKRIGNKRQPLLKRRLFRVIFTVTLSSLVLNPVLEVKAALLDIEIFTNQTAQNNSLTTPSNRWSPYEINKAVIFTTSGSNPVNLAVNILGQKKALLVIPSELANKVSPNGSTTIDTNVTVNLAQVAVLTDVLKTVGQLTTFVDNILNGVTSIVGININLDEVVKQLALLKKIENFGAASFQVPTESTANGRVLTASIDQGLGPILAKDVSEVLTNLVKAVNAIKIEVKIPIVGDATAAVVNGLLSPIKTALASTVEIALIALKPTGEGVQQLADAAVLGETTVKMPTLVSGPVGLSKDLDAKFISTIAKIDVVDINLLTRSSTSSYIYFEGERLNFFSELLPSNLDFGTHVLQTALDEEFVAKEFNESTPIMTTGLINLSEKRRVSKSWQVKVKQMNTWKSDNNELSQTKLRLHLGDMTTTFNSAVIEHAPSSVVELIPNEQQSLVGLQSTSEIGEISLPIKKFELFIPKNIPKKVGTYKTTLVWTVTESP